MSAPGSAHLRTVETCGFADFSTHKRAPIFPQPGLKNGVTQLRSSPSQLPAPACPGDRLRARRCSLRREDGHGNTDQQPAEGARHFADTTELKAWVQTTLPSSLAPEAYVHGRKGCRF